jgi:hypothetical protein
VTDPGKPPSDPANQARPKYLLKPTASRQVECSRRMIAQAAEGAGHKQALVLGAGGCEEIPLAELADRFALVTLNDIERDPLETALAGLPAEARAKIEVRVGDLTGVTDEVVAIVRRAIDERGDADAAINAMAAQVAQQPARGMQLEGSYDLVVASCLLSQLDFWLIHRAAEAFETRYPGQGEQLRGSSIWTAALEHLAERLQRRFVDDLAALTSPGARLYFAESTHVCFIELTAAGQWQTEGKYRMLAVTDLAEYFNQQFAVIERDRWEWIVRPPQQAGDTGRLFEVQALALERR